MLPTNTKKLELQEAIFLETTYLLCYQSRNLVPIVQKLYGIYSPYLSVLEIWDFLNQVYFKLEKNQVVMNLIFLPALAWEIQVWNRLGT